MTVMYREPGRVPAGSVSGRQPLKRLRWAIHDAAKQEAGVSVNVVYIEYGGRVFREYEDGTHAPERREMWEPADDPHDHDPFVAVDLTRGAQGDLAHTAGAAPTDERT